MWGRGQVPTVEQVRLLCHRCNGLKTLPPAAPTANPFVESDLYSAYRHDPPLQLLPGPAMLPPEVLDQVRADLPEWHWHGVGQGASVMEVSHRGKAFEALIGEAEQDLRDLLSIPANYRVIFMQGGAWGQFAAVPMNLLRAGETADYLVSGGGRRARLVKRRSLVLSTYWLPAKTTAIQGYQPETSGSRPGPKTALQPRFNQASSRRAISTHVATRRSTATRFTACRATCQHRW